MAKGGVVGREKVRCACGACGTYAVIFRHACGCVRVEIYNDRSPCAACTNFSAMRYRCRRC